MGLDEVMRLARTIKENPVLVQLPAGLMPRAFEFQKALGGRDVLFSGHPCFGACDIQELVAAEVGAKAILNVGHSRMDLKTRIPVYFVEWDKDFPRLPKIDGLPKRVGLVTMVQYVKVLDRVRQELEDQGHEVYIGAPGPLSKYMGQVTGCDVGSATTISHEVEGYVLVGASRFHGLKVAVETEKPVWMAGEDGRVEKIGSPEINRELKKKAARRAFALSHKTYGLLVSTKSGQFHKKEAEGLKALLEKKGKTTIIIVGNVFRSEELGNFSVDCFVTTACPRLVDDYEVYGKPIYSLEDF